MSDLLIQIGADIKNVKQAYEDIRSETEKLEDKLTGIAKISGIAFAGLSAQVAISLHAFAESEASSKKLTLALQNQGIFTTELRDKYKSYAEEVSKLTGIEDDELTAAQAVAQSFLGQIPVTRELTGAIADLATEQGVSMSSAAETLGKAISNGSGQLLRMGVHFDATDTAAQRYAKTMEFVSVKAGGFAAEMNTGLGSIKGLKTAFNEAQQELGERFAPAATAAIGILTKLVAPSKESSGEMMNLKAALIATGLAMSGLGVVLPVVVNGFLAARAAALAFSAGLTTTGFGAIVVLIGVMILAVVELALHWKQTTAAVVAVVQNMAIFVSKTFAGLGDVIKGALTFNVSKIKAGLEEIGSALGNIATDAKDAWNSANDETKKSLEFQDQLKRAAALRDQAFKNQQNAIRAELQKAEDDAILLELRGASSQQIALKKAEIDTLTKLEKSKNPIMVGLLKERLHQIRDLEVIENKEAEERHKAFEKKQLVAQKNLEKQHRALDKQLSKEKLSSIEEKILTERQVKQNAYITELEDQIAADNTFLEEQNKYGTAYATINQLLHTKEIEGLEKSTGQLVGMTQSKNATLKGIGKAASIANIVVKSAESAMDIYAGFSVLPPWIGIPLGIAGAAAAIAFGAEQIDTVAGAVQGGTVAGSGYGDKMPYMLEPGELVAPRQNFDEVVTSVAQSRGMGKSDQGGGYAQVDIRLSGDLGEMVEASIAKRQRLNVSILKKVT